MTTITEPIIVMTHVIALPAPLHDVRTACGVRLDEFEHPEFHRLVVAGEPATCEACAVATGCRSLADMTPGLPVVTSFDVEDQSLRFTVAHRTAVAMAAALARLLDSGPEGKPAVNYVEMQLSDDATGKQYICTVQRGERPSPHDFRKQAESKLDAMYKLVLEAAAQLEAVSFRAAAEVEPCYRLHARSACDEVNGIAVERYCPPCRLRAALKANGDFGLALRTRAAAVTAEEAPRG